MDKQSTTKYHSKDMHLNRDKKGTSVNDGRVLEVLLDKGMLVTVYYTYNDF